MGGALKKKEALTKINAQASTQVADWDDVVLYDRDDNPIDLQTAYTAIESLRGRLARTARTLNVSLIALGRAVQDNPVLFELVQVHTELVLDTAEDTVAEGAANDPWVALELLKRKGRHRGYGQEAPAAQKLQIEFVTDWRGESSVVESSETPDSIPAETAKSNGQSEPSPQPQSPSSAKVPPQDSPLQMPTLFPE